MGRGRGDVMAMPMPSFTTYFSRKSKTFAFSPAQRRSSSPSLSPSSSCLCLPSIYIFSFRLFFILYHLWSAVYNTYFNSLVPYNCYHSSVARQCCQSRWFRFVACQRSQKRVRPLEWHVRPCWQVLSLLHAERTGQRGAGGGKGD